MTEATLYARVNEEVLQSLDPPTRRYWMVIAGLAAVFGLGVAAYTYQLFMGMGVAGIGHPVGWGVYIVNFVFWVGIAHSGTLISAVLYLFRVRWRTAIYRAAEAMTVFAVMTAGLFPLIHLGRVWVMLWMIPIPNARHLWPNFKSPLMWDVVAVSTYFTVSSLFFYLGLIPDIAAVRDRSTGIRRTVYGILSLGWQNRYEQWRHYARAYVAFACLATPLVISVHSVVSWDFAMSVLPGWHTTIFPPYFVAGAIHSGLAMVITLLIPIRKWLRLERLVTLKHFEGMAQMLVFMGLIMTYSYGTEAFAAWYSGNKFEHQFSAWRAFGPLGPLFWGMVFCNCVVPMVFFFKRARTNLTVLMVGSLLVNVGMYLERFVLIITSTAHDFLPTAWGSYAPTIVELTITVAAFAWFFMLFLLFAKHLPAVAIMEMKEQALGATHGGNGHG
ncbi:MAG TPA: NrfD/PsrC family molybdoenzyme membrane anchor subunit [Armatimonadota bacterium]|jgi:molybdopterin-containing oxidoreductase family membrane subunit